MQRDEKAQGWLTRLAGRLVETVDAGACTYVCHYVGNGYWCEGVHCSDGYHYTTCREWDFC